MTAVERAADICVLCGLIQRDSATWVVKQERAVAFAPLQQDAIAPGHTLVVPRKHCDGVMGASDEDLVATVLLVRHLGQVMQDVLGATGICVLNASGPNSGRSVEHLHWHVIPRYADDGDECLPWPSGRSTQVLADDPFVLLSRAMTT